jgi:hypothetical protein
VNSEFGIDAKAADADPTALNHDQLSDAIAEAVPKYEDKKNSSPDPVLVGAPHPGRGRWSMERPFADHAAEGRHRAARIRAKRSLVNSKPLFFFKT